jgi:hypothetical protein
MCRDPRHYQPPREASRYILKTKDEVHGAYQAFAAWACTQHRATLALKLGLA